jgi:hypothetical protein
MAGRRRRGIVKCENGGGRRAHTFGDRWRARIIPVQSSDDANGDEGIFKDILHRSGAPLNCYKISVTVVIFSNCIDHGVTPTPDWLHQFSHSE